MKKLKCQMKVKGKKAVSGGTRPETFEKRPISPPAFLAGRCIWILILEIFNPAVSGIPVVKILMRLDLDQN